MLVLFSFSNHLSSSSSSSSSKMADQGTYSCSSSPSKLPSGFRFDPTREELIEHYVKPKNEGGQLPFHIPKINPFKHHPKTLPADFQYGIKKENYYFTQLDPRSERGSRVKRSMKGGFWKTTSKDKEIGDSTTKKTIGFMKTFAFYEGSPKKRIKTNWIMQQFRCEPSVNNTTSSTEFKKKFGGYVLCKIYQKPSSPASSISVEATDNGKECVPMASTEEVEPGSIPQFFTPQHYSMHHQTTSNYLIRAVQSLELEEILTSCPTGKGIIDPEDQHLNQFSTDSNKDLELQSWCSHELVDNNTAEDQHLNQFSTDSNKDLELQSWCSHELVDNNTAVNLFPELDREVPSTTFPEQFMPSLSNGSFSHDYSNNPDTSIGMDDLYFPIWATY